MITSNKNLFVLFKTGLEDENAIKKEVEGLAEILRFTESPEQFCTAHELVDRNRITSNHKKIQKHSRHFILKPFRFFINKN